jgi:hypothetical protein
MKAAIMGLALTLATATPAGAVTYLSCSFPGNPTIDVTMDEANSRATVHVPRSGKTFAFNASFGPEEVRFENDLLSYIISRTTLEIRRVIRSIRSEDVGVCTVKTAPVRKF